MLDVDHRQFFTVDSLRELLEGVFERSEVHAEPPARRADRAALILPRPLLSPVRAPDAAQRDPAALLLAPAGPGPGAGEARR